MIDYRAATDVSNPNVVRFFEQYEDAATFEAHSQTEPSKSSKRGFPTCSQENPKSSDSRSNQRPNSNSNHPTLRNLGVSCHCAVSRGFH